MKVNKQGPRQGYSFESERCLYRPWEEKDAERFVEIYSNPIVYQYLGSAPKPVENVEKARLGIERWRTKTTNSQGLWAVVEKGDLSDTPFGTILMVPLMRTDEEPTEDLEIGWHFDPSMHGRGFATEAARKMIELAKRNQIKELRAVVYPENVKSLNVCYRLGMTENGITSTWYKIPLVEFMLRLDVT